MLLFVTPLSFLLQIYSFQCGWRGNKRDKEKLHASKIITLDVVFFMLLFIEPLYFLLWLSSFLCACPWQMCDYKKAWASNIITIDKLFFWFHFIQQHSLSCSHFLVFHAVDLDTCVTTKKHVWAILSLWMCFPLMPRFTTPLSFLL
jgi:hypothetical protein